MLVDAISVITHFSFKEFHLSSEWIHIVRIHSPGNTQAVNSFSKLVLRLAEFVLWGGGVLGSAEEHRWMQSTIPQQ